MSIMALHEVRDHGKLERLIDSMSRDGWVGRPVLALDCGDHLQALTGSHRVAAAEQAGIDVDVYVIEQSAYTGDNDDEVALYSQLIDGDDDDRRAVISELVERGLVNVEAKTIMDAEDD